MLSMIFILLNLLSSILCPRIWSIMENVPCVLLNYPKELAKIITEKLSIIYFNTWNILKC